MPTTFPHRSKPLENPSQNPEANIHIAKIVFVPRGTPSMKLQEFVRCHCAGLGAFLDRTPFGILSSRRIRISRDPEFIFKSSVSHLVLKGASLLAEPLLFSFTDYINLVLSS